MTSKDINYENKEIRKAIKAITHINIEQTWEQIGEGFIKMWKMGKRDERQRILKIIEKNVHERDAVWKFDIIRAINNDTTEVKNA